MLSKGIAHANFCLTVRKVLNVLKWCCLLILLTSCWLLATNWNSLQMLKLVVWGLLHEALPHERQNIGFFLHFPALVSRIASCKCCCCGRFYFREMDKVVFSIGQQHGLIFLNMKKKRMAQSSLFIFLLYLLPFILISPNYCICILKCNNVYVFCSFLDTGRHR